MGRQLPAGVRRELTRLAGLIPATGPPRHAAAPHGEPGIDTGAPLGDPQAIDAMAAQLYACWYLQPPLGAGEPSRDHLAGHGDLSGVLRAAHAGSTRFTSGWVVQGALAGGACIVGRADVQRVVAIGSFVNLRRPGVPVAPGEEVAVARVVDRIDEDTRWWGCQSELGEPQGRLGRHYLHPRIATAGEVVHDLTEVLLDAQHTWALKCPIDPAGWQRPDALVVYAPRDATPHVRAILADLVARAPDRLVPQLPPLTEPVGPLASYADDPGGEHSFGSHLCQALAPGALALADLSMPPGDPVDVLADALCAAGLDPARPWLDPRDG
jgi:hypothetical protein